MRLRQMMKGLFKPRTSTVADDVRKKAYEEEKIKLAEIEGRKKAQVESENYIKVIEKPQQATQTNWQGKLQSLSDALDATLKPTIKPIKDAVESNVQKENPQKTEKGKKMYVVIKGKKYTIRSKDNEKPKSKEQPKQIHDGISPTFSL